jgi:hypothetical protein
MLLSDGIFRWMRRMSRVHEDNLESVSSRIGVRSRRLTQDSCLLKGWLDRVTCIKKVRSRNFSMEGACVVDLPRPCGREKKERMEDLLEFWGESIFDSDGKSCQASILESLVDLGHSAQ